MPYFRIASMPHERQVSLFRNGRNQAIRIPREFELEGSEAIIYKEGERLIIEPLRKKGLRELLASLSPLEEDFPEVDDMPVEGEDIF
jgi:antitoxin VapB